MAIIYVDAEGIATVVDQQSAGIGDCNEQDSEVVKLSEQKKITGRRIKRCSQGPKTYKVVRPESTLSEQEKITGRRIKQCSQGPKTYKRKKRWVAGKSDNINMYDNIIPMVSDAADGRKKHARVRRVRGSSMKRAPEVPGEYPSYTRCMKKSNVVSVFWLHISSDFCRRYLPNHNVIMTLEDEDGQRDHVNYISGSYGLSGGWKNFAIEHSLEVGDTVVFQLVMPTKFKVYIRRKKEFRATADDVRPKEVLTTKKSSSAVGDDANNLVREEEVDAVNCTRSPDPAKEDLDGIPSFKELNIFIDGLLVYPEVFPDRLRWAYYELCREQKALLHRNLPTTISHGLVMRVIMETTKIAEGISAASTQEDLAASKRILLSFELLGMDVGFLRKRVDDFLGLPVAWSSTDEEPSVEKDCTMEMTTANDALKGVEIEMEEMESSAEKIAEAVRQIATAPW